MAYVSKLLDSANPLHVTLQRINWVRGRGDVTMIYLPRFEGAANEGAAVCQKQYGKEVRRFTVLDNGRRVRFLGTTRVIAA